MGRDPENDAPFDEMDLSAMKEIGNIITASYLSALSSMTNLTIYHRSIYCGGYGGSDS